MRRFRIKETNLDSIITEKYIASEYFIPWAQVISMLGINHRVTYNNFLNDWVKGNNAEELK